MTFSDDRLGTTTSEQLSEHTEGEEVSIDASQELSFQELNTGAPWIVGPDDSQCGDSVESSSADQTIVHKEQRTQLSWSHDLSATSVGSTINEQKTTSDAKIQECTVQYEQPGAMALAGCHATDVESGQSDIVFW